MLVFMYAFYHNFYVQLDWYKIKHGTKDGDWILVWLTAKSEHSIIHNLCACEIEKTGMLLSIVKLNYSE